MASAWVERRQTRKSGARHVVRYRIGGRESALQFGGSFLTQREAKLRRDWIRGEIASLRVPELSLLERPATVPTLRAVAAEWKASRVDVSEGTRVLARVALDRVLPTLGDRSIDTITGDDVAAPGRRAVASGRTRETIRKTVKYLAAVLDDRGRRPEPGPRQRAFAAARGARGDSARPPPRTSRPSTGCCRPATCCRSCGSTGRGARVASVDPARGRLRRACSPRPAAGVDDEDAGRAVG